MYMHMHMYMYYVYMYVDPGRPKLNSINYYVLQLFMFHVRSRKFSAIFDDKFSRNDDIHNHNTKLNVHLHVPLTETNLVKTSVCYNGVTRWNYYIKFTDTYCSLDVYKKRLKIYFHNPQCKCKISTILLFYV